MERGGSGGKIWKEKSVSGVRKSWQNQVDLHVYAHIIGGDVQDKQFFSEWPPSSVTGLASTKKETVFGSLILPHFCVCGSCFSYLGLWLGVCICQDSPALASRVWETLEGAAVQSRQVSGGRLCPPVVDRRSHWVVVPPVLNTFLSVMFIWEFGGVFALTTKLFSNNWNIKNKSWHKFVGFDICQIWYQCAEEWERVWQQKALFAYNC